MSFTHRKISNFNIIRLLIFSLFIFIPLFVIAQKEANVWPIGSGQQFNFQSGNIDITTFSGNENAKASICDKDGNLALYSDGRTVWNRNNEILINGEGLIKPDEWFHNLPVFVPYPKKDGWYILFYELDKNFISSGHYNNTIYFAEINTNASNGKGEVVRKNVPVHNNYHYGPTIAGYCNNSYYWLIIDRNDNLEAPYRDRIYFYKIDENGVTLTPKIDGKIDIGNSFGYKLSANGDKLYFRVAGNTVDKDIIADFNFSTGKLYNLRFLTLSLISRNEFSPNSRFFYFFSKTKLIQLDVSFSDSKLMLKSADTLITLASDAENIYPGHDLKLAPDGKIYFSYYDITDKKMKIGRISKPNNKGNSCEAELNFYTIHFDNFSFPEFVTSFFREKYPENPDEIFPDAGPELTLCSNSTAPIGVAGNPDVLYQWIPDANLTDPFSAETFLNAPLINVSPDTITYTLRATDGNCWVNFDSTKVNILPVPYILPIYGSWSVCPFVERVDYWTVDDGNTLQWLVNGGEIATSASNDSIKINWFVSNPLASVSVFSINNFLCRSATSVFPVRINVELITETPKGPTQLCIAESKNILYQIQNTNGSVYNWIIDDGEIIKGQGTSQVAVNWLKDGQQSISVEETSLTIDTICFGKSKPLVVKIVNDSLDIYLNQISFNMENKLVINYSSAKLQNSIHSLSVLIQSKKDDNTIEFSIPIQPNGEYIYSPNISDLTPDKIQLKVTNSCDEVFYSNRLQAIVLYGKEILSQDIILLNWNKNQFWENDKLKLEIWHSENGINDWELISADESGLEYNFPFQGLSLTHYFRVKEINEDRNRESWSNILKIVIDDKLTIPDVFTPNGDGINDIWQIKNIQFHPAKRIVVYNKLGQVVFESQDEYIPWDGKINGEIIQGTYFYQITFDPKNIRYGQVTILQ